MSVLGRWRIVEIPGFESDYPDMMEPAYLLFETGGSGDFAFGCVTGHIFGSAESDAVEFSWEGNDEMDEASGHGWAEIQADGSLEGEICFDDGDDATFVARRTTSSTAR